MLAIMQASVHIVLTVSQNIGVLPMAYTNTNFPSKKSLKEAVAAYKEKANKNSLLYHSGAVRCYQPGLGPDLSNFTGKVCLEGPHYPKAHTWYAEAELIDGVVVKVK